MRSMRFLCILGMLMLGTGCYHYVPMNSEVPPQGTPLRAYLGSLSSFELAQITVNNVQQVEGELVRLDQGDIVLSATWLEAPAGIGYPGNGWTVRVPQANVTAIEQREVSWWRTGIVVGAIAVGTWLGFEALGVGPFGSAGGGGGTVQN